MAELRNRIQHRLDQLRKEADQRRERIEKMSEQELCAAFVRHFGVKTMTEALRKWFLRNINLGC